MFTLEMVGDYSVAFITLSAIGLVVSAVMLALKGKPFVNPTT